MSYPPRTHDMQFWALAREIPYIAARPLGGPALASQAVPCRALKEGCLGELPKSAAATACFARDWA